MEIYGFKDWWKSAYHQKNISKIFIFNIMLVIFFPIQLYMLQWPFISPLYYMFSYGMLIKLDIMSH